MKDACPPSGRAGCPAGCGPGPATYPAPGLRPPTALGLPRPPASGLVAAMRAVGNPWRLAGATPMSPLSPYCCLGTPPRYARVRGAASCSRERGPRSPPRPQPPRWFRRSAVRRLALDTVFLRSIHAVARVSAPPFPGRVVRHRTHACGHRGVTPPGTCPVPWARRAVRRPCGQFTPVRLRSTPGVILCSLFI